MNGKKSVSEAILSIANDFNKIDLIDARTMRDIKKLCLPKVEEYTPEQIRKIRLKSDKSQGAFAKVLNISSSTVSQWERGEKKPIGASLKLLSIVDKKGLEVLT